ncbi:MAG: hypothetical protein WCS90_05755 [Bacilli bacterium]
MDKESVKLGRINRAVEKALGVDLGEDIWISMDAADLDKMAAKWPNVYLSRLEEASKIIKTPDYAAYSAAKKTLFLIKEYLRNGEFSKVVLEIEKDKGWHLKVISVLNALKTQEIDQDGGIKRIEK